MMQFKHLTCFILVTFIVISKSIASPFPNGDDPSVTVEKDNTYIYLESDGNSTETFEIQYRLNEERGLKREGQQQIYLNNKLDKLVSIEAYTQKADGRKITISEDQIKTKADPSSAFSPMFNDSVYKIVIFPDLAVGDKTYLKYTLKREPLLKGHFTGTVIPSFYPYKESISVVDVPENITLNVEASGFIAVPPRIKAGRKIYEWHYALKPKSRIETGSVDYIDYGDRLQISTFKDYSEMAKVYEQGASDKSKPTPKVIALAKEITKAIPDKRAQALALSDWVRKNIRYVAIYLGNGGVVPHAAEDVLNNRYGDCKDHTVLLEALLTAVNIDSSTALINSGGSYRLPNVPVLSSFNHVITFIPSLNLYTDSTALPIDVRFIPDTLLDKSVLITKTGVIAHTPVNQLSEVRSRASFEVHEDGSAQLSGTVSYIGLGAEYNRYRFRNTTKAQLEVVTRNMLLRSGLKGEGTIELAKEQDRNEFQDLKFDARVENLANLPGASGITAVSNPTGGIAEILASYLIEKKRTQPFPCVEQKFIENASYFFPPNVKVQSLPKSVEVSDPHFSYSANYTINGNKVELQRQLEFKPKDTNVCKVTDFEAMQSKLNAIARDLKAQILIDG
ncbi:DUF3857 domain-containing transglutaminase family protein [Chitinimonas sp. BJB300]|uniref:DUF3857 domain-containing transglutaminase family protein n=1 Tax=Chitinimonas sp. BJB300 TaxID=1559339 RepID=UPI000C1124DF|nr:DUF3857 and transglutaminase domain-containing protein [Chitinimonas sp. BJB300]PHV09942.1 hypothetical protein CSQ89_18925 [Chitinimonas sp. BJB300]TSJ83286.1 DUF3857 domain-containing protein [Chitinimonas sp. BJB300]